MKHFFRNIYIFIGLIFCLSFSTGVSSAAGNLPADDVRITFCLINSDPGKDLDECLTMGGVFSTQNPGDRGTDKSDLTNKQLRQNYLDLVARISEGRDTTIDSFKQSPNNFEFVSTCGIHFSSGEHPLSIRCHIANESQGIFDPDIVLSISWSKLIWNSVASSVETGNAVTCAVAFDLNQVPADPEINAQQIVEEFNQSPSCTSAGLSAIYTTEPAGTFVDIFFSPQNVNEMSMPGPQSMGTLTY